MNSKFSIVKNLKIFGIISILLCAVGIISIVILPVKNLFNLTIDFAGGTEMEFNMGTAITPEIKDEVTALFKDTTGIDATVKEASDTHVIIRSTSVPSEERQAIISAILEKYSLTEDAIYGNNDVSPAVGQGLQRSAFLAAIVAVILMMIYITIRFELTSGLAAVCCLLNDLFIIVSVYVIFQIPLDSKFIAVALTILGYSINASIIVFDRVRENLRLSRKEAFDDIAERSLWQTMGRTINTTLTTLITVAMICILVPSLRTFAIPLIVGIISGAYSSIMLSASLWGKFRKVFHKKHA